MYDKPLSGQFNKRCAVFHKKKLEGQLSSIAPTGGSLGEEEVSKWMAFWKT